MLDSAGLGLRAVGMEGSTVVMFSEANFFKFYFFFNLIWISEAM